MKKIILSAVALLVVVVILGLVHGFNEAANSKPIRMGAIFMLTGLGAANGENSKNGADLAMEEINAAGGINGQPLEIVYQDNQGDNPKEAVNGLNALMVQGINIVLGPNWTPSGLAVAPIACGKNILMVSPSLGVAGFNEACDHIYNLWQHDDVVSHKMGEYIYDNGYKRIAILGSMQEWEKAQAEAVKVGFESKGGKLVSYELSQKGETDFNSFAAKIKNSNPDAVVMTNYSYMEIAAKKLRDLQVKAPFFAVLIDDKKIEDAGGALEGTIAGTSFTPSANFIEKYKERFRKSPDYPSDTAYDSVKLIAQAIKETKSTDTTVLKNYLNSLTTYDGESGHLTFDGKGGVTKKFVFLVVKDGKTIPLGN